MVSQVVKNLSNLIGWRTSRKIVVFESDDWGSIRMPSNAAFETLSREGLDLVSGDAERYNRYDTIESDLSSLFDVLLSERDLNGNPFVVTALCLVANPDFVKIKEGGFRQYFCEPVSDTLQKYGNSQVTSLYQKGIANGIFIPQFHGREHLNVLHWMRALQQGDKQTHIAFEQGCWGFNNAARQGVNISYQAAFDFSEPHDLEVQKQIIIDGLNLFKKSFGYEATFFVPPNGPFNNSLELTAFQASIFFMSASKIQYEPQGAGQVKKKFHYLGQQNSSGQYYITRNCVFEPSQKGKDWVESCLNDIAVAFRWNKPAVISSHRVNYVGGLDKRNRDSGLNALSRLISCIKLKWPNVEFMTSAQLGGLIKSSRNQ